MPRINEILGDVTQVQRGTVPIGAGAVGSGLNRQKVEARKIALAARRQCCKTCKGSGCVGYCKY